VDLCKVVQGGKNESSESSESWELSVEFCIGSTSGGKTNPPARG
jgi:hypothetical protein